MSMAIGLGSGLNSCVGIFIYLAKHPEIKKYFLQLFPSFKKLVEHEESQAVIGKAQLEVVPLLEINKDVQGPEKSV